jgi:hypothetical protein
MSTNKLTTLEDQLFTYGMIRENGPDLELKDVILKVAMGTFPVGSKFPGAYLSTSGAVGLKETNGKMHLFHLSVSVGEQIDIVEFMKSDSLFQEVDSLLSDLAPATTTNDNKKLN